MKKIFTTLSSVIIAAAFATDSSFAGEQKKIQIQKKRTGAAVSAKAQQQGKKPAQVKNTGQGAVKKAPSAAASRKNTQISNKAPGKPGDRTKAPANVTSPAGKRVDDSYDENRSIKLR